MTDMNNTKKFAVILGGSGALGRAVSKKLLLEGVDLLITGRDKDKLISLASELENTNPGRAVIAVVLDFEKPETFNQFLLAAEDIKDRITIVVNTAAGFYKGSFCDMTEDQISSLIDSNFKSVVIIVSRLLRLLKDAHSVDMINITSYSSATDFDTSRSSSLHIATKNALEVFDTVLGTELLKSNSRLTTVAPGTYAKNGRVGLPLGDLADLIWLIHGIPTSIRINTVVASYRGE